MKGESNINFNKDNFKLGSFAEKFLEEYMANGFTSLPKKEIDLLVLRLKLNH